MTDPMPQPEIPPTDPTPIQPEMDPGGAPDEIPAQPQEFTGTMGRVDDQRIAPC